MIKEAIANFARDRNLPNFSGVLCSRSGSAKALAALPGMSETGPHSLSEDPFFARICDRSAQNWVYNPVHQGWLLAEVLGPRW
jgi:hypothetical protein